MTHHHHHHHPTIDFTECNDFEHCCYKLYHHFHDHPNHHAYWKGNTPIDPLGRGSSVPEQIHWLYGFIKNLNCKIDCLDEWLLDLIKNLKVLLEKLKEEILNELNLDFSNTFTEPNVTNENKNVTIHSNIQGFIPSENTGSSTEAPWRTLKTFVYQDEDTIGRVEIISSTKLFFEQTGQKDNVEDIRHYINLEHAVKSVQHRVFYFRDGRSASGVNYWDRGTLAYITSDNMIALITIDMYAENIKQTLLATNKVPVLLLKIAYDYDYTADKQILCYSYVSDDMNLVTRVGDFETVSKLPSNIVDLLDPVNDAFSLNNLVYIPKFTQNSDSSSYISKLQAFTLVSGFTTEAKTYGRFKQIPDILIESKQFTTVSPALALNIDTRTIGTGNEATKYSYTDPYILFSNRLPELNDDDSGYINTIHNVVYAPFKVPVIFKNYLANKWFDYIKEPQTGASNLLSSYKEEGRYFLTNLNSFTDKPNVSVTAGAWRCYLDNEYRMYRANWTWKQMQSVNVDLGENKAPYHAYRSVEYNSDNSLKYASWWSDNAVNLDSIWQAINHILDLINELNNKITNLQNQINELNTKIADLQQQINDLKNLINNLGTLKDVQVDGTSVVTSWVAHINNAVFSRSADNKITEVRCYTSKTAAQSASQSNPQWLCVWPL